MRAYSRTGVLTTGQVAHLCGVASRTVTKWIDSGKLKGYRLPCSTDRRVVRGDLADFLRSHGMAVPAELGPRVVILGGLSDVEARGLVARLDGWEYHTAADPFALGLALGAGRCDAAVLGGSLGLALARRAAQELFGRAGAVRPTLLGLPVEDHPHWTDAEAKGFDAVLALPFDPAACAAALTAADAPPPPKARKAVAGAA